MALRTIGPALELIQAIMVANDNFRLIDNRFRSNTIKLNDGSSMTIGVTGTDEFGVVITNSDGSQVGLGKIPGFDEYGFFSTDSDGVLVSKQVEGTTLKFRSDGTAYYISGVLPGTSNGEGDAYAKDGEDVRDAFS